MLRISIQDNPQATALKFEGKLVGVWVQELNRLWRDFEPTLGMKKLFLDVRDMTFVDEREPGLCARSSIPLKPKFSPTHP